MPNDTAKHVAPGEKMHAFAHRQPARQADGESREQDVERNHERELNPRQDFCIERHGKLLLGHVGRDRRASRAHHTTKV
jgi:hypothetical protein